MKLGSIADAFAPPMGYIVKMIIGFIVLTPLALSVDFDGSPLH